MVSGTLYTYPNSFRGYKCAIAALYSGFGLKVVEVQAGDKRPHVPSFESSDKKTQLFESTSIAYYVANDQLRGTTLEDKAQVLQWVNYGNETVASAVASWVYPALSLVQSTPELVQKAKEDVKQVFQCVNDYLKTRTFLVGERLSLADISLAADLLLAFTHIADESFRKPYTNLNRWFLTVVNQTNVKKVVGEVTLCSQAPVFCAAKHAEHQKAMAEHATKEKKAKEPKPAKAAEPAKPKAAPKKRG